MIDEKQVPTPPLPVKITEPAMVLPLAQQPKLGEPSSTPLPDDTPTTQAGTLTDMNTPPKAASNMPYIIAVVAMIALGIIAVVVLASTRKDTDIIVLIGAVFGVLTPTTLALLSFMKSQETHLSVNSRLDGFIKNAQMAALAQGNIEGRDVANLRNERMAQRHDSPVSNEPPPPPTPQQPSIPAEPPPDQPNQPTQGLQ